jgi:WD40 repeat protein
MDKPISRKRALSLYRDALERGDFDTVAAVLWLAERDPELVHMISNFHQRYDASAPVAADSKPRRGIIEFVRIHREPSPDGWPLKPDQSEEDIDMFTTFAPTRSPYFTGARKLRWDPLTLAAAVLVVVVLGIVLLFMRAALSPGSSGAIEEAIPEFAAQPEACAVETEDAQAESIRLAGEATTLLETEGDNTELATLLGICALQTAYTPEADMTFQQALSLTDALQQFEGHTWYINGFAFSSDGQYLYSGSADQSIRVWDIQSRAEIAQYRTPAYVMSLALSPDGRYLVTGEYDNSIRIRDVETGEVLRTFTGSLSTIFQLTFSSDGKYLLAGTLGGELKLWDFSTGQELQTYRAEWGGAMSPDGRYVATVEDGQIHLYNVGESEPVGAIEFTLPPALYAAFSPDGRYLLLSGGAFRTSSDNIEPTTILLLDRETGAEVRRFEGHNGEVYLGFSPDGKYVLSASNDGTAMVWDAESGQQLRIFTNQLLTRDQGVAQVTALSPDGRQIVIGYETGMVVMWPTDYHDTIARACEYITRDFTDEERQQYSLGAGPACP